MVAALYVAPRSRLMVDIGDLRSLLPVGGLAAIIAVAVTYLFRTLFEAKLKAKIDRDLANVKDELETQREYIKELVKKQTEYFPGLATAVYRSRNIARDLFSVAPKLDANNRATLGDLALRITEGLFEVRIFLPPDLFSRLHQYKKCLQNFIFEYDEITRESSSAPRPALRDSLRSNYEQIDELHEEIVRNIQNILDPAKRVSSDMPQQIEGRYKGKRASG